MSVSTEVQRTLVKSPPELWAELGSAEGLARHLGEIGEIRVTKLEPETRVEWEADRASGVVELKQSGWGTKVTLSLTRQAHAPEPAPQSTAAVEPEAAGELAEIKSEEASGSEPVLECEATLEPEPDSQPEAPQPQSKPVADQAVVALEAQSRANPLPQADPDPEPKRGLFARLFKRRRRSEGTWQPAAETAEPASQPAPEIEIHALAQPEPVYPGPPPKPQPDEEVEVQTEVAVQAPVELGAELAAVEAQMEQESTELLTGILDRLGAAHHRPFSRA